MGRIHKEHLQAGYIYGDSVNHEFIYLPPGEIGTDNPICILETANGYEDLPIDDACKLISKLSLKETTHPTLGKKSF